MSAARLTAIVGLSRAGKASGMEAVVAKCKSVACVQHVVTRPPESEGELFTNVSDVEFGILAKQGVFALHRCAHGLQ